MKLCRKHLLWEGIIIYTNEGPWSTGSILASPSSIVRRPSSVVRQHLPLNHISSETFWPISMKLGRKYLLWVGIIIYTNEGPWSTGSILARPNRCAIVYIYSYMLKTTSPLKLLGQFQ